MTVVLLIVVAVWVTIPFVPAIHEALRGHDARSLPVADSYREDVRIGSAAPSPTGADRAPMIVRKSFVGKPGLETDEVRARKKARLGAGSTVRRLLEAGRTAEVDPGSVLRGSAQAGDHLWLGADVQFERVHAPTIDIGVALHGDAPAPPTAVAMSLPPGTEVLAGRALLHGDFALPAGAHLDATLVVIGDLRLGMGARICGNVKAHGAVTLATGAVVTGNVFAKGDVTLDDHAAVTGAAASEETLRVGSGAVIGLPSAPTTATGRAVLMASGARVHGTLWAEASGRTLPAEVSQTSQAEADPGESASKAPHAAEKAGEIDPVLAVL